MTAKTFTLPEAIAAYLARDFRVVPLYGIDPHTNECRCGAYGCRRPGKHEPTEIEDQYRDGRLFGPEDFTPESNIAIAMGPWREGRWLLGVDLDGTDNVQDFFGVTMPATLMTKSPKGLHLIYTVPAYAPYGNWVDCFQTKHAGFALDLRYARGRLNVHPSVGLLGEQAMPYQWLDWRAPAPFPDAAAQSIFAMRINRGLPVDTTWDRQGKVPG